MARASERLSRLGFGGRVLVVGLPSPPSRAREDKPDEFTGRCAKRAEAIQSECFGAGLLVMTGG